MSTDRTIFDICLRLLTANKAGLPLNAAIGQLISADAKFNMHCVEVKKSGNQDALYLLMDAYEEVTKGVNELAEEFYKSQNYSEFEKNLLLVEKKLNDLCQT